MNNIFHSHLQYALVLTPSVPCGKLVLLCTRQFLLSPHPFRSNSVESDRNSSQAYGMNKNFVRSETLVLMQNFFLRYTLKSVGQDSVFGIAARYWMDGPGIESRWGGRFSAPVQIDPVAHAASYTMVTESLTCGKRPRSYLDYPPHLAPRLKKDHSYTSTPPMTLRGLFQGDLYLYSAFCTLTF